MKHLILIVLSIFALHRMAAQGRVEVIVDPAVSEMDEARDAKNKAMGIKVYHILVAFYPSRQSANEKLSEVKGWFGSRYSTSIYFDEPNFKVFVGEFTSKTDAEAAWLDVKKKYPSSTIVYDYKSGNH